MLYKNIRCTLDISFRHLFYAYFARSRLRVSFPGRINIFFFLNCIVGLYLSQKLILKATHTHIQTRNFFSSLLFCFECFQLSSVSMHAFIDIFQLISVFSKLLLSLSFLSFFSAILMANFNFLYMKRFIAFGQICLLYFDSPRSHYSPLPFTFLFTIFFFSFLCWIESENTCISKCK